MCLWLWWWRQCCCCCSSSETGPTRARRAAASLGSEGAPRPPDVPPGQTQVGPAVCGPWQFYHSRRALVRRRASAAAPPACGRPPRPLRCVAAAPQGTRAPPAAASGPELTDFPYPTPLLIDLGPHLAPGCRGPASRLITALPPAPASASHWSLCAGRQDWAPSASPAGRLLLARLLLLLKLAHFGRPLALHAPALCRRRGASVEKMKFASALPAHRAAARWPCARPIAASSCALSLLTQARPALSHWASLLVACRSLLAACPARANKKVNRQHHKGPMTAALCSATCSPVAAPSKRQPLHFLANFGPSLVPGCTLLPTSATSPRPAPL